MSSEKIFVMARSDNWTTPKNVWELALSPLRDAAMPFSLYDPFYNDGKSEVYAKELGFDVIPNTVGRDYTSIAMSLAEIPKDAVVFTNLPYSTMEECVAELVSIPHLKMVLVVPETVLFRPWFNRLLTEFTDDIIYAPLGIVDYEPPEGEPVGPGCNFRSAVVLVNVSSHASMPELLDCSPDVSDLSDVSDEEEEEIEQEIKE